jgi:hypothetical protein
LPNVFSISIEMIMWFLSFFLIMCCIMFIDFHMINHFYISGIKPPPSWYMIFKCVFEHSLQTFYCGFLH